MFKPGDTVRVLSTGAVGQVIDSTTQQCLVKMYGSNSVMYWFKENLAHAAIVESVKQRDFTAPDYYVSDRQHQPYDVINDWELSFGLGNVVKYISRAGRKTDDPIPDLEKARVYLDMEIARLRNDG